MSLDANFVLNSIASLLTADRQAAAFAHYPTLRIHTRNLHNALSIAINDVNQVITMWRAELLAEPSIAVHVEPTPANAYRVIAPILIQNVHQTAAFLLEETRPAPAVGLEDAEKTKPSYSDFIKLGSAVRCFLDALVQAAYQLATFNGLQLNYKFLQSLLSFASVAPPALHANIVSPDIQAALDAYLALSSKDRRNSSFTKDAHGQFPQRLDVAAERANLPEQLRNNLKLVFSFCSDFVHSGYISVLALDDPTDSVIMGGSGDAFVSRAENFAEVKLRLLETCTGAYTHLLIPILEQAIGETLRTAIMPSWTITLESARTSLQMVTRDVHRRLVEPVRRSLITNGENACIECRCGGHVDLAPPHHAWDRYCGRCGAQFTLLELPDEVDYIISDLGAGDVLGSDAPKIAVLPSDLRAKLERLVERHRPTRDSEEFKYVVISDLARCDEKSLAVPSMCTTAPAGDVSTPLRCFVPAKSLERCAVVQVRCNCGASVDYQVTDATLVADCDGCGTRIGLIGVSGDGVEIITGLGANQQAVSIQARDRFTVPGIAINGYHNRTMVGAAAQSG
ncbi:hypothetical protein IC614_08350 [Allosphingosinicella flava]|uniref:Uncharacterized protein n=1 Tax=Allosphingosinicella flava TaxID=2771430 RepID=A0A7T2GIX2_9SPHN|nr:hypothetical protein [Sphingosinicella flava]QPQ54363.1 hypothetical protein IC614_08350 [Sphingosinicella flava]